MEIFTVNATKKDLREYIDENLEIGGRYKVHAEGKKGLSSALSTGYYTAVEKHRNICVFKSPEGCLESFTLMDTANIIMGIAI